MNFKKYLLESSKVEDLMKKEKLTFNEDIDAISSLNFKNIVKNHEKLKINYSSNFELN